MLIYPDRIRVDEPLTLSRDLPASILEFNESLARQHSSIHAELVVTRDGSSLLVTGELTTTLQLRCGRCAEWMDWPIKISDFVLLLEPPLNDSIDLTPSIREDILLDLPVAAACRLDEKNRCPISGTAYLPADEPPPIIGQDAWKELDKLKDRE